MNTKLKNTRVVTFEEDYFSVPGKKSGNPIYKKGSTHAIHQRTVALLKDKGAKMKVKEFDEKRAIELVKKAMADDQKHSRSRLN